MRSGVVILYYRPARAGVPALLFSAFLKLKGGPEVAHGIAHLGLPERMIIPLSILEISCTVIYLIPARFP